MSDDTTRTPIGPQPKQIVRLNQTLGARPTPTRPTAPTPAAPTPPPATGPAPREETAPATVTVDGPAPDPRQTTPTPVATAEPPAPRQNRPRTKPPTAVRRDPNGPARDGGEPRIRRRDQTVFYLPIDVSDQLRDLARRQNKTNADVIFDAIEAAMPDLSNLFDSPAESPAAGDGVFQRAEAKPVGKKVQVSAVVSDPNLAIIDDLVVNHGAESRSQLVEVSLNAYFAASSAVSA